MATAKQLKGIERLNRNGYKTIHLFGDFYLIRMWSTGYKKFSPYILYKLKKPKGGGTDG